MGMQRFFHGLLLLFLQFSNFYCFCLVLALSVIAVTALFIFVEKEESNSKNKIFKLYTLLLNV